MNPIRNSEIYYLYKDLNIVDDIKIRRLGWAGHVMGLEDLRIPKKVLNGKFHNKDQWENQEQDGRMSSRGTHHRS